MIVGVDVGGTKLLAVRLGAGGGIESEARVPTPAGGPAIVAAAAALVASVGPADAVGIGLPGLVDRDGLLRVGPNLPGVVDHPFGEELSARLGVPVTVDNDATCAAWAEHECGAARGASDAVCITLGTGIGAGIVAGGVLQRGRYGFAGELGHMVVDPDGPQCPCGRRGCWERYASGSGLARLGGAERGEDVVAAARAGDAGAIAVIDEFCRWVALGVTNAVLVLDPEVVVLGGGLSAAADLTLDRVRRDYEELVFAPARREPVRIVTAELGEHAGAIGAALLAAERLSAG